jgi:heat shock protein HslJ
MFRIVAFPAAMAAVSLMTACAGRIQSGSAKASGASPNTFRATGNEPGWRLDVAGSNLTFIGDYGQIRIEAPVTHVETTAAHRQYAALADGHDLLVRIFDQLCTDTMSGMPHPNAVEIVLDGKQLNGCGGDPGALLQGAEWRVQEINGTRLIDGSEVTLSFAVDGRISGATSCNRYTGAYTITGETLTISNTGVTMMACDPALMQQEDLFLDVVKGVHGFAIDDKGALILRAADGRTIEARRA